jgi:hypothetical protein
MDTFPISDTQFIAVSRKTGARKTTSKSWAIAVLTAALAMTNSQVQADSWISAGSCERLHKSAHIWRTARRGHELADGERW